MNLELATIVMLQHRPDEEGDWVLLEIGLKRSQYEDGAPVAASSQVAARGHWRAS